MSKKPYRRARFDASKYQIQQTVKEAINNSVTNSVTPKLIFKRIIATISSALLVGTFVYDAYMYRDIEVNVIRQITTASELSNPCASVQALEDVISTLTRLKMNRGNTALIPNTPIYPSEPIDQDLGVYNAQLKNSQAVYNLQCEDMFRIEPAVKALQGNTEEQKEQEFARLISKNRKLAQYVQTADYSTTQSNTDNKLLAPDTKKASIPPDIHLMPYLRQIILTRYLCMLILFVLYFFDVLKVLQKMQLFKLVIFILDKTAPWKLK
jgi:hypothetical protein